MRYIWFRIICWLNSYCPKHDGYEPCGLCSFTVYEQQLAKLRARRARFYSGGAL